MAKGKMAFDLADWDEYGTITADKLFTATTITVANLEQNISTERTRLVPYFAPAIPRMVLSEHGGRRRR